MKSEGTTHVAKAIDSLDREFHRIWLSQPAEVRRLREDESVAGAFRQKGSLLLYTHGDTAEIQLYLFYLKSLLSTHELPSSAAGVVLAKILDSKANQWRRYYKLDETPALMEEAAAAARAEATSEDLTRLIDSLILYLGRLNLWLDQAIPWAAVCSMIDWSLKP